MRVEDLVVRHSGWISRRAWKYCNNSEDAEDLAGETIFKCLNYAGRFNTEKSFKPWVAVIMENTFKTLYNRRKCVRFFGYEDYDSYKASESSDQRASLVNLFSIIRKLSHSSLCISSVLLYAKGYTYEEIACREKIPIGTVRSRIAFGRKLIRNSID